MPLALVAKKTHKKQLCASPAKMALAIITCPSVTDEVKVRTQRLSRFCFLLSRSVFLPQGGQHFIILFSTSPSFLFSVSPLPLLLLYLFVCCYTCISTNF